MARLASLDWIAGFLEGEGYFYASPKYHGNIQVGANQVQLEPLERLQFRLGGTFRRRLYGGNQQDQWAWSVRGTRAVEVMMTLYSLMSPRRQEQIREALDEWRSWGVANKNQNRCKRGHAFDDENTFIRPDGRRQCRMCRRESWRKFSHMRRAVA